jgi:uncharacterized protein YbjT (DUF2867 family)
MIVVTGATGRTGRSATEALLAKGEKVRVVGRDAKKLAPFVERGAESFIGNVEDVASMTTAFNGASVVYLVLPEDTSQQDLRAHQERVSDSYAAAIDNAHVRFVVNLSSIGAQHAKNTGPIVGLHNQEQKLNRVVGLSVLHLRAAYFMENLFMSIASLRSTGMLRRFAGRCANTVDSHERYWRICRHSSRCPRFFRLFNTGTARGA